MLRHQSPGLPTDVHGNEACESQLGTSANIQLSWMLLERQRPTALLQFSNFFAMMGLPK